MENKIKTSREKVMEVFEHRSSGDGVMWTGNPTAEVVTEASKLYGIENNAEALYRFLDDDCRWIPADSGYRHPEGRPAIDTAYNTRRDTLSAEGCFADATLADIEAYPWPDVKYCDFTDVYKQIDQFQDKAVFTGMWGCFFHLVADFFGMENYFVKMYTDPDVVEAVTEHVVDFYLRINERLFEQNAHKIDMFFFGNDFGSQLDTLISPEMFDRFVMPAFVKFTDQAHRHGMKVLSLLTL